MFDFIFEDIEADNVTHEYLSEFEELHNIIFPNILREYYTKYNRAKIKQICFEHMGMEFEIEFIIPLKYANINIEKIMSFNANNKYIPASYIPLAEDVDGDDYYWDARTGKVYYLSLENVEHPIPIADSVESFFELLNRSVI